MPHVKVDSNSKHMTEEKKTTETTQGGSQNKPNRGRYSNDRKGPNNPRRGRRRGRQEREPREFEQKILDLARVTRVTKGGKRMRFRTCLIIGDRKGRVGMGVAKGADVAASVEKAFRQAKKNLVNVELVNGTIPHRVDMKFGAAKVILKPAPEGTGLKSGGPVRLVLELAGVPNAVSKVLGTNNKINNAKATFEALRALKAPRKTVKKAPEKKEAAKTEANN